MRILEEYLATEATENSLRRIDFRNKDFRILGLRGLSCVDGGRRSSAFLYRHRSHRK